MKEEPSVTTATGATRSCLYPKGTRFPCRLDLFMRNAAAIRRMGEVYGEGEAKYGPDNWMKGFEESVLIAHAIEHIRAFLGGDITEDHLAHAMWNLGTLMWVQENRPELLDLTKPKQVL